MEIGWAKVAQLSTHRPTSISASQVGVYDKTSRAWRIKSRNKVNSMISFDVDGDGVEELISGWDNGKLEVTALGSRLS